MPSSSTIVIRVDQHKLHLSGHIQPQEGIDYDH